jgi:hypothetical protein
MTDESFSNITVYVEADAVLWNFQLFRDIFNWGIWKVFGQVGEPYNNAVSGVYKVLFIVTVTQ